MTFVNPSNDCERCNRYLQLTGPALKALMEAILSAGAGMQGIYGALAIGEIFQLETDARMKDIIDAARGAMDRSEVLLLWGDEGPPTFPKLDTIDIQELITTCAEYDGEPRNRAERREKKRKGKRIRRGPSVGRNHFDGADKRSRRGQR